LAVGEAEKFGFLSNSEPNQVNKTTDRGKLQDLWSELVELPKTKFGQNWSLATSKVYTKCFLKDRMKGLLDLGLVYLSLVVVVERGDSRLTAKRRGALPETEA
jgi:hypothetical protein